MARVNCKFKLEGVSEENETAVASAVERWMQDQHAQPSEVLRVEHRSSDIYLKSMKPDVTVRLRMPYQKADRSAVIDPKTFIRISPETGEGFAPGRPVRGQLIVQHNEQLPAGHVLRHNNVIHMLSEKMDSAVDEAFRDALPYECEVVKQRVQFVSENKWHVNFDRVAHPYGTLENVQNCKHYLELQHEVAPGQEKDVMQAQQKCIESLKKALPTGVTLAPETKSYRDMTLDTMQQQPFGRAHQSTFLHQATLRQLKSLQASARALTVEEMNVSLGGVMGRPNAFLVKSGRLGAYVGDIKVREIGPGEIFGEISAMAKGLDITSGYVRTADIKALEGAGEVELVELNGDIIEQMCRNGQLNMFMSMVQNIVAQAQPFISNSQHKR